MEAPAMNSTVGKVLLSWSTGKDCAWTLHTLRTSYPNLAIEGLLTTFNETTDPPRVAMHATRLDVARAQAKAVGLPLWQVDLPSPCPNSEYAHRMKALMLKAAQAGITHIAFGDLHLADVRAYRETMHEGTGMTPIFPIWSSPAESPDFAQKMVASGVTAVVLTVDLKKLSADFAGRSYDATFLKDLPEGVDHMGEFGEFHTLATDGPAFAYPLPVIVGERVVRENGFVYTEVTLSTGEDGGGGGLHGRAKLTPYPVPLADVAVHLNAAACYELVPQDVWDASGDKGAEMAERICPSQTAAPKNSD